MLSKSRGERNKGLAAHYRVTINPGKCEVVRLRLNRIAPRDLNSAYAAVKGNPFGADFDAVVKTRLEEADQFYATVIPSKLDADAANVMRQAVGGMLWSKQFYNSMSTNGLTSMARTHSSRSTSPRATTTGTT